MAQVIQANQQQPGQPPRPPRKNPYRDGSSKCAQQYDVFDMIRNPHAVKRPLDLSSHDNAKGRLSKQQKIDQEIQKKFQQNPPTLLWNRFKFLRKITKVLFFIAALPFYLLLYQIPKVICLKLIPFVINSLKMRVINFKQRMVAKIKTAFYKIIAPFIWLRKACKRTREFLSKKIAFILSRPSAYAKAAVRFASHCLERYHSWINSLKNTVRQIRQAFRKAQQSLHNIIKTLRDFPLKLIKKAKGNIKSALTWIKIQLRNLLLQPFTKGKQLYKKQIARLKIGVQRSVLWIRNIPQRQRRLKGFYSLLRKGWVRFHQLNPRKFNKHYFQEKNHEIALYLAKIFHKLNSRMHSFKSSLKSLLAKLPLTYIKRTQKCIQSIQLRLHAMRVSVRQHLHSYFKKQTTSLKLTTQQITQHIAEHFRSYKIFKRTDEIKTGPLGPEAIQSDFKRFKIFLNKIWMRAKPYASISIIIFTWPKTKVHNLLLPFLKKSCDRLDRTLLQMRTMVAWTKVLFIYGLYQLAIVSKEIGLGL